MGLAADMTAAVVALRERLEEVERHLDSLHHHADQAERPRHGGPHRDPRVFEGDVPWQRVIFDISNVPTASWADRG